MSEEFDPLGPLREYRDAAASLSKIMPDMNLQLSKHVVALNNLIVRQEEAVEEHIKHVVSTSLTEYRKEEEPRRESQPGYNGPAYEDDVLFWEGFEEAKRVIMEMHVNRGITDGDG